MAAATIIRPTVRVNEFGVYAFPPNLGDSIIDRTVEIRDWYGAARGRVLSVALGRAGYPVTAEIEAENGAHVPAFSLHSTREIELI